MDWDGTECQLQDSRSGRLAPTSPSVRPWSLSCRGLGTGAPVMPYGPMRCSGSSRGTDAAPSFQMRQCLKAPPSAPGPRTTPRSRSDHKGGWGHRTWAPWLTSSAWLQPSGMRPPGTAKSSRTCSEHHLASQSSDTRSHGSGRARSSPGPSRGGRRRAHHASSNAATSRSSGAGTQCPQMRLLLPSVSLSRWVDATQEVPSSSMHREWRAYYLPLTQPWH